MTEQEATEHGLRIARFRELQVIRNEIVKALKAVTEPWPNGPHGQGPFTGNTRESRKVRTLHIFFTATRGGAAEVDLEIQDMHLEAYDLGKELESMLRNQLAAIEKAIKEI